jgi:hypothetical protein
MEPISVELRLALDLFKGDVAAAEQYVKDKLGNLDYKGTSGAKQAADADKFASSLSRVASAGTAATNSIKGVSKGIQDLLNGMSVAARQRTMAANPHLASAWAAMNSGPAIKPPGVARAGFDPLGPGDNSTRALVEAQKMDAYNSLVAQKQAAKEKRDALAESKRDLRSAIQAERQRIKSQLAAEGKSDFLRMGGSQDAVDATGADAMQAAKESVRLSRESLKAESNAKKAAATMMGDRANFMKDMSFLMMPLMNPGSVWATLFSTRQTFSAFSKTAIGKGMVGGTLGGAAMATGVLVGAATALGVALMVLKKIVSETVSSFEYARSSYAKSLMSGGLGVGFSIRRAALADILGVSEKDVFKFGLQVQYLNERLKTSTSILSQYNPTLTETSWSMKLFWQDLKAFGAVLAARAPVQGAIKKIDEGTKAFAQAFQTRDMVKDMREYAKIHGFGLSEPGLKAAFKMSPEEYRAGLKFTSGINNPLADQRARFETWSAQKHRGNIPPAMAFMDQLGASKWEKMGLVMGGGMGAQNHLRQIVANTKKTADAVGKWASAIPRSGGFSANPAYNSP